MRSISIVPVTAFVDWNTQIHECRADRHDAISVAEKTLSYIGKTIGRALRDSDEHAKFDVELRIYHGWHKGFEPTINRKAIITAAARTDFLSLSNTSGVSFKSNILFGDRLNSAPDARLHVQLGIHLPNTLRWSRKYSEYEEKMVDTAICAEVVDLAHREPDRWILVLADDDDMIPAVYIADGIKNNRQRRVLLLRKRPEGPFFKLEGLRVQP